MFSTSFLPQKAKDEFVLANNTVWRREIVRKDEKGSLKTKKVRERRKKCAIFFRPKRCARENDGLRGVFVGCFDVRNVFKNVRKDENSS